jgi:hypothetical protein
MAAEAARPTADGEPPGAVRRALRYARAPFASLLANLKLGLLTVLATFLLAGWGTALMTFSWEMGWLNSFHKGYEISWVGPTTGLVGLLGFVAAMFYVPMAQAHLAVTGDFKAFFEFRFVWRLIRARLSAYVALAALFLALGTFLEILKTAPYFFDSTARDRDFHAMLWRYTFFCSFMLLLGLLATRLLGAALYRSAVLKVLRRGRASLDDLHPRLRGWLEKLQLVPAVQPLPSGAGARWLRAVGRWGYRRALFTALFFLWLAFGVKTYVGEFLHYHPVVGLLNHPLVQVPCMNYIPAQLAKDAKQ